ncbi:recombinase, partial [Escherichia coli]|nr:recombinase [Escherichia coli]
MPDFDMFNPASNGKRLARTVLIFTERSDQLSRATDRVPGLPA